MREEGNIIEGRTVVLEHAAELSSLSPSLRRLVPASARALFEGYPRSLEALSAKSGRRALADALARLAASGRCELEIHRSGHPRAYPSETYVRFGERPVLLSGGYARVPSRCAPALAAVLRLVGVVRMQYGFSLGLLAPSRQQTLARLGAQLERTCPGELAALPMPTRPETFHAFYECSGAYVCADRSGATWNFSLAGGDYGAGPPVDAWLDGFFEKGPFGQGWPIGH